MQILFYTVQDTPIGRGGMGQVYLGTDPQGRRVAIKEMLAQYVTDPHLRQRFHQEVNILNQLEHPAIVKMYALFEERGNLYLVMEYVEGKTIEQCVQRRGVLPEKEATTIMSQILSALNYAHSKGFVHRDIKPGNIMIRPDGSACLLDFGIAKDMTRTGSGSGMTTTFGMTIGTVGYMSPEQAEGLSIDHRSDIYSLGCVLFYMLTGQHAVKEESSEIKTRIAIVNNPFPKAKLYNPNISNDIQKVLNRATNKNMSHRFQSCSEFETALCRDGASLISTSIVPPKLNGWGYFLKCFKQYTDFKGRATRKEFWCFMLCNALAVIFVAFIGLVGGIVLAFHFKYGETALMGMVYLFVILYLLTTIIPALAVSIRRLHDSGKSGWWCCLVLAAIILFILYALYNCESGIAIEDYDSTVAPVININEDYNVDTVTAVTIVVPSLPKESKKETPKNGNTEPVATSVESKDTVQTQIIEPEMVFVQGGTFMMGCTNENDKYCRDIQKPVHQVTVSSFNIGKYEVTQAQWKVAMGNNPSFFKGNNLPVEQVSWNNIQKFIDKLNSLTGKNYRLPTEVEWEFAARGGKKSKGYIFSGSNNTDDVSKWPGKTYPTGSKQPNELGIYDMTGNVSEWCSDLYGAYTSPAQTNPIGSSTGTSRVTRGGCYRSVDWDMHIAHRYGYNPGRRDVEIGFRLVLPYVYQ
ncbi:MAG: SUMF1/EgtB/PvdO family nonheme iron enzyme [Prevotellaceae bacterium]|jgi:formylglycine-generating enzyme required for sulfatase activity|nr:SUMF1/EgtB/PvdO family nonheme iron enzyme [Prevotellaceae bacterium]